MGRRPPRRPGSGFMPQVAASRAARQPAAAWRLEIVEDEHAAWSAGLGVAHRRSTRRCLGTRSRGHPTCHMHDPATASAASPNSRPSSLNQQPQRHRGLCCCC